MLPLLRTIVLLALALPGLVLPQGVTLSACLCPVGGVEVLECCGSSCPGDEDPSPATHQECEACQVIPLEPAPRSIEVNLGAIPMLPSLRQLCVSFVRMPTPMATWAEEAAPGAVPSTGLRPGCRPLRT